MMSLRIVIADDEPLARHRLRRLIDARPDCLLVSEHATGHAVVQSIAQDRPDLLVLDIDMPGMNGFEALSKIADPQIAVIFVTAHAAFAQRAFEIDAVDYLLKPISAARLDEALRRARRRQPSAPGNEPEPDHVRFETAATTYLLRAADIVYLQARGNYLEIGCADRTYCIRGTLAAMARRLDGGGFVRVHRSWMVNATAVRQVTALPGARHSLTLHDGRTIPGGKAYYDVVIARFRAVLHRSA